MQQNNFYDVIIIGASEQGLALAEQLENNGSIALVSTNFDHKTKKQKLDKIELIENTVVYLGFIRGLFGVTFKNNESIFGHRLVFAMGTKPVKLTLKNQNVKYNLSSITNKNKNAPAVVYGSDNLAVKYTLELAKLFKYVYLCSKPFELECDQKLVSKLDQTSNVVHLPGCSIASCKNDSSGKLLEVTLDTYDTIKTSELVVSIGRTPDLQDFTKQYIAKTEDGFAVTKDFSESTLVPNVYAIGGLLPKHTKKGLTTLANKLKEEIANAR